LLQPRYFAYHKPGHGLSSPEVSCLRKVPSWLVEQRDHPALLTPGSLEHGTSLEGSVLELDSALIAHIVA
jgi:hypothetical protein